MLSEVSMGISHMFKKSCIAVCFLALSCGIAQAGDTVTVNLPGGATQTAQTGATSALFQTSSPSFTSAGDGSSVIAKAVLYPQQRNFTIESVGGRTFNLSSMFATRVLLMYQ